MIDYEAQLQDMYDKKMEKIKDEKRFLETCHRSVLDIDGVIILTEIKIDDLELDLELFINKNSKYLI